MIVSNAKYFASNETVFGFILWDTKVVVEVVFFVRCTLETCLFSWLSFTYASLRMWEPDRIYVNCIEHKPRGDRTNRTQKDESRHMASADSLCFTSKLSSHPFQCEKWDACVRRQANFVQCTSLRQVRCFGCHSFSLRRKRRNRIEIVVFASARNRNFFYVRQSIYRSMRRTATCQLTTIITKNCSKN